MRRPVRTITRPPISSRRIRFGEPTSPCLSGVIVAAFSPSPCSRIARAASCTTAFCRRAAVLQRQVVPRKVELEPDHVRLKDAQRLLEQFLAGLVALQHRDRVRIHRRGDYGCRSRGKRRSPCPTTHLDTQGNAPPVPLLRREGPPHPRPRDDRAARQPRDPAGVEGRQASPRAPRAKLQATGVDSAGRHAVPLSPGLPRPAGGGQVRGADPVRREAAGPAAGDGRAPDARSARPALRLRSRDSADQPRVVPCRLGPAHEAFAHLRRDDAAQVARARAGKPGHVPLPREGQGAGAHGARRRRSSRTRSGRCSTRRARGCSGTRSTARSATSPAAG